MRWNGGMVCAMLVITACVASILTLSVMQSSGGSFRGGTQSAEMYRRRQMSGKNEQGAPQPHVLILTPVKNAAHHIRPYFERLTSLSYPHELLSVALLDSDSTEEQGGNGTATTFDMMQECATEFEGEFRRIDLFKRNFGLNLARDRRHDECVDRQGLDYWYLR